jgi:serine phosphatase RsbU (regulator of sigma subunit)
VDDRRARRPVKQAPLRHERGTAGQHVRSDHRDRSRRIGRTRTTYVGAGFSLFIVADGEIEEIKGNRAGIGYRGIPYDQAFAETVVDVLPGQQFYMSSDGLIDQVGGDKNRSISKRRLKNLIAGFGDREFDRQCEDIVRAFTAYQGEQRRRDDIAMMGFAIRARHG